MYMHCLFVYFRPASDVFSRMVLKRNTLSFFSNVFKSVVNVHLFKVIINSILLFLAVFLCQIYLQ